uniref:sensor histidine kinase n=1 Tax=Streptomyces rhizosphaerihabitans TaxID=1266770 RepID=UPI0028F6D509|nr:nitrate- and nitrite sensing domain-containing protein [Streptomyces rhizosphaerihabitans]
MRAPVQKTRPRRTGKKTASNSTEGGAVGDATDSTGRGRTAHVRSRLIVAVAVVAAAIAGAGAPTVLSASQQLNDSQNLVRLAQRTQQALTLAHALADERDDVTSYVAAGRPKAKAPSEQRSALVDRQVDELRADETAPAALLKDLDGIAALRRAALTGKSGALEAHQAYSGAIAELHALAEDLADRMPPRAGSGAHALAELDTAVEQSAAARGLLLAALGIPRTTQTVYNPVTGLMETTSTSSDADTKQRDALSAAAQQARVRSDASLADFRETAPEQAVTSYDSTVTGPDVGSADKYLANLTGQPKLSDSALGTSTKKLDAALSARIDLMRGAEASLNDHRTKDLEQLRDDDVTALEIRITLLGVLLLVAAGVTMAMARTLTRPLAVLRLGSARLAADPGSQEPVKFTGRNDEFAQVIRSVNALHAHAATLHERIATLEGDRKHLIGQRQLMADERDKLRGELAESAARLEQVRGTIHSTFVNLALRTLGLVERQLGVIEGLEEREQDPDRLSTLFKLDHFATVMRRHSENLLVLAGAEHVQHHAGPVPLVDVVRASVSEIERYERVRIAALPPHAHIAGFAADDISHLVAELLENATSFSPPDVPVEVSGWLLESGDVMLSVQDEGIGMTDERMRHLNARLAEFDPQDTYDQESGEGLGLGLYVVARLAHRHGVRVKLREQKQGGVAAVVVLPKALLAAAPSSTVPATARLAGAAPVVTLPGADAEANSNVLRGRSILRASASAGGEDPLIAAAKAAVRDAAPEPEAVPEQASVPAPRPAAQTPVVPAPREPEPVTEPEPELTSETTMELLLPELAPDAFAPEAPTAEAPTAEAPGPDAPAQEAFEPVAPASEAATQGAPAQDFAEAASFSTGTAGVPGSRGTSAVPASGPPEAASASGSPESTPSEFGEPAPVSPESASAFGSGEPDPAPVSPEAAGALAEPAPGFDGTSVPGADEATSRVGGTVPGADEATLRSGGTVPGADGTTPRPGGTAPGVTEAGSHPGTRAAEPAPAADQPAGTTTDAPVGTPAGVPAGATTDVLAGATTDAPAGTTTDVPVGAATGLTAGQAAPATDPYAIGPDSHERAADEHSRLTDKGLPKRTPKISAPAAVPRPRVGGVDADALRRRLGGFHRGAVEGRRDVEAEIADRTAETPTPEGRTPSAPAHAPAGPASTAHRIDAQDVEASGGTVEEASS